MILLAIADFQFCCLKALSSHFFEISVFSLFSSTPPFFCSKPHSHFCCKRRAEGASLFDITLLKYCQNNCALLQSLKTKSHEGFNLKCTHFNLYLNIHILNKWSIFENVILTGYWHISILNRSWAVWCLHFLVWDFLSRMWN